MDQERSVRDYVKWGRNKHTGLHEAYYKLRVPGVSTILSQIPDPDLDKWKEEVGEEKAEAIARAAAQRGTAMHAFIENFLNELKESNDPSKALKHTQVETPRMLREEEEVPDYKIDEGRNLFYSYYHSEMCGRFETISTEMKIYSPTYFYRGILDLLFRQPMYDVSVTDFKTTSSRIQKGTVKERKYKTQLGGYALAMEDMYRSAGKEVEIKYASIVAVHSKRLNSIQVIECKDDELARYKEEFVGLATRWHRDNGQAFLVD